MSGSAGTGRFLRLRTALSCSTSPTAGFRSCRLPEAGGRANVSDRLEELRRLRALQREQLASIEREIAALEAAGLQDSLAEPPELDTELPNEAAVAAEAILREYSLPSASIEKRTKYGCFLYLCAALALVALALAAVYFHARATGKH